MPTVAELHARARREEEERGRIADALRHGRECRRRLPEYDAAHRRLDVERCEHCAWLLRKAGEWEGEFLLHSFPEGFEFELRDVASAYAATYRRNADGLWDQVRAPSQPLVKNMDGAHLAFAVGPDAIARALTISCRGCGHAFIARTDADFCPTCTAANLGELPDV